MPTFARYPVDIQRDQMDCGPTCLRMIARAHGRRIPLPLLRERCALTRNGVSMRDIARAAESIGFRTLAAIVPEERLVVLPTPFIAVWRKTHFVVVYELTKGRVTVGDPAHGLVHYDRRTFWEATAAATKKGPAATIMVLEPTPRFDAAVDDGHVEHGKETPFAFLWSYVRPYRPYFAQIIATVVGVAFLSLAAPFLTQAIVDVGVRQADLSFVQILLAGYTVLYLTRVALEVLRAWLVLHVGVRVNVALLSDFLAKLMRLPIAFFEARRISDLLQRVGDQARVERLVTTSAINVVFACFSTVALALVLLFYSGTLFLVFASGIALAGIWTALFLGARAELDYRRYARDVESQSLLLQILRGLPELRLAGAEHMKRWQWQGSQAGIFRLALRSLALGQAQDQGTTILLEGKDLLITFLAAREVIAGRMTLGMMLAVQYLLGQVGGPIRQLLGFVNVLQDARLGLERLEEIHREKEEIPAGARTDAPVDPEADLLVDDVTFRYGGPDAPAVLEGLRFRIASGKVTAIVGSSGSGKTTLLKLLLRTHEPERGDIRLGGASLRHVDPSAYRAHVGAVLQDGYLFSESIARNIALGHDDVDAARLQEATTLARLDDVVASLPLGYATLVGEDGMGLSKGQEQRVLIARALYRRPRILVFDEATSALDATNERAIVENLARWAAGRTVVIVAHRLSTVRNADHIVVLAKGKVAEEGSHDALVAARGPYFSLVRNQLELGT